MCDVVEFVRYQKQEARGQEEMEEGRKRMTKLNLLEKKLTFSSQIQTVKIDSL